MDEPDDGTEYFHYWLKHDVAIFFCTYYVLMVWVLVQMVVAVILDQVGDKYKSVYAILNPSNLQP